MRINRTQLLPTPTVPVVQDAGVRQWMHDITKLLEVLQSAIEPSPVLPICLYADTSSLKQLKSRPVFVPDHPDGASIIIWDGTDWQRFTAAGTL